MERVAILGMGLMGASLGLALRGKAGFRRVGYARRQEVCDHALEHDVLDEAFTTPGEAATDADILVACVPIYCIPPLIEDCRENLKPGAIVTDVGSTKSYLVKTCGDLLKGSAALFVGSHPIAGSEQQGVTAGRSDLYLGKVVVVTPDETCDAATLKRLETFWQEVGATVRVMDPEAHDRMLARTSHLPHMLATALVNTVCRSGDPKETSEFCGTGFKDTSRIADGSEEVWTPIAQSNRTALLEELQAFRSVIDGMIGDLEASDFAAVESWLKAGREGRGNLLADSD